jgi:NAD(P)-dependent dehydrogenase (short-subunit alcohol dehydrogenase family)
VATQVAALAMRAAGGGTILFTGGGWADHPGPAWGTVSLGKAALRPAATMLGAELAGDGIRVASITIAGPRRVNHQDLVTTAHPPGGEARFVAKGPHGHQGAPGDTRRSEPPVNTGRFTYISKEESGGIPNGITTCGRK